MSESMPLYTLCKEDLDSMDREVRKKENCSQRNAIILVRLSHLEPTVTQITWWSVRKTATVQNWKISRPSSDSVLLFQGLIFIATSQQVVSASTCNIIALHWRAKLCQSLQSNKLCHHKHHDLDGWLCFALSRSTFISLLLSCS